jgi:hypothetical protein
VVSVEPGPLPRTYRPVTVRFRPSLRIRWLMWRLRNRVFWGRVWAARSISPSEWRARYRGIKILETSLQRRIERAVFFGN